MKRFADYNPISVFSFYAGVTLVVMFSMDPVLLALSLAGSLAVYAVVLGRKGRRGLWFYLVLPLILGIDGIWWSIVVAEGMAVFFSALFLILKRKRFLK